MKTYSKPVLNVFTLFVLLVSLLGSALTVTPVYAAGITVNTTTDELNSNGNCSLREAIKAANTDLPVDACTAGSGADTITLPAGAYTLIGAAGDDLNLSGDLDITSSLTINGAGAGTTTIQASDTPGSGIDRVLHVFGPYIVVSISDVTIANGKCTACEGGGIYSYVQVSLTLTNTTFSGNSAANGGGIYSCGALPLTLTNSTLSGNSATNSGGGFFADCGGYVSVANSMFSGNSSPNNAGGGIFNGSFNQMTVTNSTLSGNSAYYAGGINNGNGNLTVTNSTFSGNSAVGGNGGGILNNSGGTTTVTNSTFSGNSALFFGGGIDNDDGTTTLTNNTFSGNSATFGGGAFNNSTGVLHLKNTILANSAGGSDCYNSGGTITTNINNLIEANAAGANACGTPAATSDPNLGLLASNGGPTQTFALGVDSVAIGAGDNATCAASPVSGLDQRGVTRPQGVQCDIGSYETEPSFIVTTNADPGDGSCAVTCSLRDAILAANAQGGADFIAFDDDYAITLNSTLPNISEDLRIAGENHTIVIDGNGNQMTEIILGVRASLNNLTIQNSSQAGDGGAILNRGTLSVTNSTFSNNSTSFSGGAIYNYLGTLTLTNSTFTNNSADAGGAIKNDNGTLTITNSSFSMNTADDGSGSGTGGAIIILGGTVTIEKSAFDDNSAAQSGGSIQNSNGTLSITNSTFSGNSAGISGGAIRNNGTLTITNSTFSGNSATLLAGGGIYGATGTLTITNSTLSGNSAVPSAGGGIYNDNLSTLNYANTIIANSPSGSDCLNTGTIGTNTSNLVGNGSCSASLSGDPSLGVLANYGGPTQTFALLPGSSAIDAGNDATCTAAPVNNLDQRGITRPGGAHCDIGAFEFVSATIDVTIGGMSQGSYSLAPSGSLRVNYAGLDSGPVRVTSTDAVPIISAIREAWAVNGVTTSFSQLMGLPAGQLSDKYVFPGYNNVTLNDQLRISNVDTVPSTVVVTIGGVPRGSYLLQPDEAVRINYPGLDSGPVIVDGTDGVNIISAIREAWAVNGTTRSFVQLMGLSATQLSDQYVFPAYNNVTLNDQLRIGNVDIVPSTVIVTIGGIQRGTYILQPDEAVRINYAGLDSGPVVVQGTLGVKIISAIREAWAVNGTTTSFSQLMGMPATQLSDQYVFPAYNNVTLNDQLRIGNVDTVPSTVTVTIGGVFRGSYTLQPDEAVRVNYAGLDSGPVVVQGTSGVHIISAIREAWAVNGVTQSFVQLMGLPFGQLSTTYLFPGYNNVTLNDQLRIGVP